ncbi:MAG: acyltransferase domain-containing protein, partial [Anaerolinea sp.]|nr:acyltransferase domain-containing protein [Anaerolinea sp.]
DTERTAVILGTAMGGELHYLTSLRIFFPEFAHALESVDEFEKLPAGIRRTILEKWHEVMVEAIPPITEDTMPGELPNITSGRVANILNLRGPSFITDAACAASFAAVSAAIEMLTEHQVDAVITGGVDRNMGASTFVKFCKIGALSATGSRPFADGADGFVMGEGAGAFLLKRLEDAERDGDKIYAVIRGVGGASDGKGKGITAPNPIGQQHAIRRAWENANLDPATASLIEAHGTSTRVGDVVEIESLNTIFGNGPKAHSMALGSVKSNIGHLKAGAGAAGLLKTTLALHHRILPPTLNAERPNPNINFGHTPFYLNTETREWAKTNGTPRRAGVSAYGFGGTNFHLVMEEYIPGALTEKGKTYTGVSIPERGKGTSEIPAPVRGMIALGAATPQELKNKLDAVAAQVEGGWTPGIQAPELETLRASERLFIDFGSREELLSRLHTAQKGMGFDTDSAWKAFQAQGIFRGRGAKKGKLAYLFPGQGSQYLNMGRALAKVSPIVREVLADADAVMTPILGKPLSSYIFVEDENDFGAQMELLQTAITQPAMLALDIAIYRLLEHYGFRPDVVMGHSLGEYAALIVSGIMPFADALEAAAARGSEMTKVSMGDNGKMAAVLAPINEVNAVLSEIKGYVVPANLNSHAQCVIGGESRAVEQAVETFTQKGYKAVEIPVSHAFHTKIVAPAGEALRKVLDRLQIASPRMPLVSNVTGGFYPTEVTAIKDLLQQQVASPVQWVKGMETLYQAGVRGFVECGPKRALKSFVDDVLGKQGDVTSLLTNHPKTGELASFNQALCGLYAAGFYPLEETRPVSAPEVTASAPGQEGAVTPEMLSQALAGLLHQINQQSVPQQVNDRNHTPLGSVVISGTGLGLPGAEKSLMDENNVMRILRGEQFIDLIPERFRKRMLAKRVTRVRKASDGGGSFETITDADEVIKLAGRPGYFDLEEEYGIPGKLIEALDSTTQLAIAAGIDALREAGIPLVQTYKRTTTGSFLPDRWMLPEALRDETGVIFASAFPGMGRFADEMERYFTYYHRLESLELLESLREQVHEANALREINRRAAELRESLEREPYTFDRRFIFRVLAMGHSQFAEYIGARGPNTHINGACASTTQAVSMAEDWIRVGRCRRVLVIAADNVTSDNLMEWVGAGFLAAGAAATDDRVEEAALPFDRRRHGTILGMGACALVVESEDCLRERGMRAIVEVLAGEYRNSAYHGTRLDVEHIAGVMNDLMTAAERRFGLHRAVIASQMLFMSHETYTPARGGSASAEVMALRRTFGDAASEIVIANTKGFTGHPMGVGVEDVIAVKALEHGIVPPVPNYKEVDPDLGVLNLSRGGHYPVQFALHFAAGFGSQLGITLIRRIPGALDRIDNKPLYQQWLDALSGGDRVEVEVIKRTLRIKPHGAPVRSPAPSRWQLGMGPTQRALVAGNQPAISVSAPINASLTTPTIQPHPVYESAAPEPVVAAVEPVQPVDQNTDPIADQVLALVAAQTGYPVDMLQPDLDLEADLGVDTVKQAETFSAIREAFGIPREESLKLRDYRTLAQVVGYVKSHRPDLVKAAPAPAVPVSAPTSSTPTSAPAPTPFPASGSEDPISTRVLEIVAAQTGYPVDMLQPDLDLEADLGVDTVKQAETFSAIREAFGIPREE